MPDSSTNHGYFALRILLEHQGNRPLSLSAALQEVPPPLRGSVHDVVLTVRGRVFLLDAVLRHFLHRPLKELPLPVRHALRIGVVELFFRPPRPPGHVVSRVVDLAGQRRHQRGLLNAVLRRVASAREPGEPASMRPRDRCTIWCGPGQIRRLSIPFLPDPKTHLADWFSKQYSLTPCFVAAMLRQLPLEHEQLFQALNTPLPTLLRPAPALGGLEELERRLKADGVEAGARRGAGLELPRGRGVGSLAVVREGLALVQDRTAAEVAPFMAPRPGERILDLCAAPGGKSIHLAQLMEDQGLVIATDKNPKRLERVGENARHLGLRALRLLPLPEALAAAPYDRVLVDAPCSNSGVLMKRVEARYRILPEQLKRLQDLQLELLLQGASLLRPGGLLCYSTCSILPQENGQLVRLFLDRKKDFELLEEHLRYPQRTLRDGGYMARLRHRQGTPARASLVES